MLPHCFVYCNTLPHSPQERKGGQTPSLLLSAVPRNNRPRVNALSVFMHSQMQMRAGAVARRADDADLLTGTDRVALLNRRLLQVTVQRGIAVAVIYYNIVAVAVLVVADLSNLSAACPFTLPPMSIPSCCLLPLPLFVVGALLLP